MTPLPPRVPAAHGIDPSALGACPVIGLYHPQTDGRPPDVRTAEEREMMKITQQQTHQELLERLTRGVVLTHHADRGLGENVDLPESDLSAPAARGGVTLRTDVSAAVGPPRP